MSSSRKSRTVLFNALHTNGGGGLTYLQGLLPELALDTRISWMLLATPALVESINIPANIVVKTVSPMGFVMTHLWEQLILPFKAWIWGVHTIVSNANYTPLLALRSVPILHTTPAAAARADGARMGIYWKVLACLTRKSVWNAAYGFTVAKHVVATAVGDKALGKMVLVTPGVDVALAEVPVRDPNLVVSVGDFYAHKDYPLLVQAFAQLRTQRPDSRLMLIGRPVDANVRNAILNLIRELKLADAVTLTGGMPHERVVQALARASVFVSTSSAETVQIPALEAMAVGTPVVTTDLPHAQEFVGDAGVMVPASKGGDMAAAFAVAMYGVLENPALANGLRGKGVAKVKSLTWAAAAQAMNDRVLRG